MDDNIAKTYSATLQEIKYRIEAIDSVLSKEIPLRAKIAEELCYLQFRMICELIAIGCLIMHREISTKYSDL